MAKPGKRRKQKIELRIELSEGQRIIDAIDLELEDEEQGNDLMDKFEVALEAAGFEIDDDDDNDG